MINRELGRNLLVSGIFTSVILYSLNVNANDQSEAFFFHVLSGLPYKSDQELKLEEDIIPLMQEDQGPFLLHLGNMKSSGSSCDLDLLENRIFQIKNIHPSAVFYTPGANEWTDCDRGNLKNPVSELEMLETLRELYFRDEKEKPAYLNAARQFLYPENQRWQYLNTVFSTIHLVGTNNGRTDILLDDKEFALSQVFARDAANHYWLQQTFSLAHKTDAKAVIIATHADVTNTNFKRSCTPDEPKNCNAFAAFNSQLSEEAARFQKPVLLLHGDSFPYCTDKRFGADIAPNLWRFNVAGDYKIIDAVTITVNPHKKGEPFTMQTLRNQILPEQDC